MVRTPLLVLMVPVLGGALLGCQAPDDPDAPRTLRASAEDIAAHGDAIRDGYADPDDPAAVGLVTTEGSICSGSLIAPNLVLTARHCVSRTFNDDQGVRCPTTSFSAPFAASGIYVTTRPRFEQDFAAYHPVREVVTLPVDDLLCGQDMALLILDEVVTPEEAVPYVPRVDTALVAGEEYYAIGYGATDDAGNGAGTRRRRDALFVDCAEEGCGQRLDMTFAEWVGDQGICSGDSGGPAIDLLHRVVGVTSRGTFGCDDPVYGSTHAWGAWVKEHALRAAELGGYQPLPWMTGWPTDPQYSHPVGQACSGPAECPSNMCYAGFCSRLCNEASPCPEGFQCETPEGFEGTLCGPIPPPPEEDDDDDDDAASASSGGDGDAAEGASGCSVGPRSTTSSKDPVTPVPWIVGVALAGAALARRRR